ncbi:DUF421 domain-containing protein [Longirhabdus pacifica]|uniref:DUF421 domain-containing protein n=1 Tax=Longirhabdus pacifica TaxID=2305227 RepID=UPI0010089D2B|nr:DUF421 domain-containing protein [Longirhabdus pacifica]
MSEWAVVIFRSFTSIIALFVFTRLIGNRQISQLNYFEYIIGISIGGIAAYISLDLDTHWSHGLIALIVWAILLFLMGFLSLKSKIIRDFIEGKGIVLIEDGKIKEERLRKARYNLEELLFQLRERNIFRVSDVDFAILEPTGSLTVMLKEEFQPVIRKDLQLMKQHAGMPQTVIMDGKVIQEPLSMTGRDKHWLFHELKKQKLTVDDVFLAQLDYTGALTLDLYEDVR